MKHARGPDKENVMVRKNGFNMLAKSVEAR